jgi:hypothetical protein
MVQLKGDAETRVGATDYLGWQFKDEDGDVITIPGGAEVYMRLLREDTGAKQEFKTDDGSPILFVTDANLGKVELRPETTTWADVCVWRFYFVIDDGVKEQAIPRGKNYKLTVKETYDPSP